MAAPARASPWNRPDGDVFLASRVDYFTSDTETGSYARIDTDIYVEYGVTRRLMAGGKAVYGTSFATSQAGTATATGLTEAEIFVQRQLQHGAHSATSIRLAGVYAGNGARPGLDAESGDLDLRALHGRDLILQPFKVFSAVETGYRRRFGGAADQIRADALIGVEPSKALLLLLEAQSTISVRNGEPGFDDFDIIKGQASIVYRRSSRWSFIAGARREFAARNIVAGSSVFVGLWSEF